MAVHIKQCETQGNEVLTSEVITPGAATLYPCLSHPSTFGSFFCFLPFLWARTTVCQWQESGVLQTNEKCTLVPSMRVGMETTMWIFCGSSNDEGIKSSLRGMNTRFLDWFKTRGTSQTDIKACVACQDARWGNSFRECWVSNKRMSSATTGESHLMLT